MDKRWQLAIGGIDWKKIIPADIGRMYYKIGWISKMDKRWQLAIGGIDWKKIIPADIGRMYYKIGWISKMDKRWQLAGRSRFISILLVLVFFE